MLTDSAALSKDRSAGLSPMQHRHFATIASILRTIAADSDMVDAFATELSYTNPNFDRSRFVRAALEA